MKTKQRFILLVLGLLTLLFLGLAVITAYSDSTCPDNYCVWLPAVVNDEPTRTPPPVPTTLPWPTRTPPPVPGG